MAYLFWGVLLIFKFPFAYLTFNLWGLTLGLPDFVGFLLVWRGLVVLTPESRIFKKLIPEANTYYCTEHVDDVEHDNVCDCANCAKCGTCNKGTGKRTVVKIHSASNADMDVYRANRR